MFKFAAHLLMPFCLFSVFAHANNLNQKHKMPNIRYEHVLGDERIAQTVLIQDPLIKSYSLPPLLQALKNIKVSSSNSGKNRIQVVYVGDGYTQQEMQQYRDDVKAQIATFLEQEPFKTYQKYFSFHVIEVPSEESGVSESSEQLKNTAFEMHYKCGGIDRLLCINLSKLSQALQKAPKADIVFALANSEKYGGAGYLSPAVATLAARNKSSSELAFHEIGHSFGKLIDEYETTDASANCNSYQNVSSIDRHEMLAKKLKWFRWLDLSHISTFKGGCYSQNFYRPTENSKMRSLKRPFEEINVEQFVKRIHEKVKLTENINTKNLASGHMLIDLNLMQPVGHNLTLNWFINGQEVSQLRNASEINTAKLNLTNTSVALKLVVQDQTTMLRDENFRNNQMTQIYKWDLELSGLE